jgi:uncharacterized protein (DUF433 family)
MPDRPRVTVDPGVRFGAPAVKGVSVEAIAGMLWAGESVDVVADEYGLTRAEVIVAAWYAGQYGLPGKRRRLAATPLWRRRWGKWAESVNGDLWRASTVDYDKIPDPPDHRDGEQA